MYYRIQIFIFLLSLPCSFVSTAKSCVIAEGGIETILLRTVVTTLTLLNQVHASRFPFKRVILLCMCCSQYAAIICIKGIRVRVRITL
jgi:hypothetical protein